jgi:hypothetical protein
MKHMQLQNYAAGQWIAGQPGVTHAPVHDMA